MTPERFPWIQMGHLRRIRPRRWRKFWPRFPCIARPIVYRWSVTQSLDYDDQLASGIRYFDLRISSGPDPNQYSVRREISCQMTLGSMCSSPSVVCPIDCLID